MSNHHKLALVTGGSRGLGKDMVLNLAKKGTDIIFTYNSRKEEAEKVAEAIRSLGNKAEILQLNTADISRLDPFIEELKTTLKEKFGTDRFDILVNNAGVGLHAGVTETTEEQFDNIMNIHLKSVYFLTQKSLPLINDDGRIINISTGLARFSVPGSSAYAAMKGAVEVYTRYLAQELGVRGITANTVAPGAIATDFGGGMVRDNKDVNQFVVSRTALGRVGEAEDIGPVVAFLSSDEAGWVNGQRIEVSGAMNI